jgi:chitodextrinase
VNGACGSANGTTVATVPTTNLCSTGTASTISGTGPWSWSCAGTNGGSTAQCSANKTFVDTTPPSVPTGLAATTGSTTQINLSWTASTDNVGVTGYNVMRNGTKIGTTSVTSYSNTGLTASTSYSYTVSAFDAAGNTSIASAVASATTQAPPDTTPPSVPTGLTATAVSTTQINLAWTASTDNVGVTGYQIFRNGTQVGTPATTSFSDTGLTASTSYSYTVKATDSAGNVSAASTAASATTQAVPVNGSCGSANGTTLSTKPTTNLCSTGNSSTVAGSGPWTWSCAGSNGGSTAQCSAAVTPPIGSAITMGETNVASVDDGGNGGLLLAQQATLSQTATLQSLSFYVRTTGGNLRLGVYDATGPNGGPGALLARTPELTPIAGWNTSNVTTPVSLPAGTYWLAYFPQSNNLGFQNEFTGQEYHYSLTYGPLPATFSTAPSGGGDQWSFYATLNTVPPAPVNGACGPVSGTIVFAIPASNLCSAGAASTVAGTGPWTWSCAGLSGGGTAQCTASKGLDTTPPSVPAGLVATAVSSSQINLSWTASTDNVGVTGYNVMRNGTKVGTSSTANYNDTGLTASTSYTYTVSAFDAANNVSAASTFRKCHDIGSR